jgi:hypothetical protein
MEEKYDLEGFTIREIRASNTALDTININGIDAAFIRDLQIKINTHIQSIESGIAENTPPSQEIETS